MRVTLGTGNGEHFWASLCWSIFLLRPVSEDVVLDSGGWDMVGASGMGAVSYTHLTLPTTPYV